jgi:hypothetical protein
MIEYVQTVKFVFQFDFENEQKSDNNVKVAFKIITIY